MSLKGKLEAIIYAAEEPITLAQLTVLVKDSVAQELAAERAQQAAAAEPEVAGTQPDGPAEPPSDAVETAAGSAESSTDDLTSANTPEAAAPAPVTDAEIKSAVRSVLEELVAEYNSPAHGIEVRQIAGGYRMATKPEHHDVVRAFAKGLKPPVRLSLAALETLAVVAYKQPVTAPEISEIRGVDCSGVLGTLLERKLITTAGRKAVIGRPILYKTTKEFLLRFGLKDVAELPSMEEFEKLAQDSLGSELFAAPEPPAVTEAPGGGAETAASASEAAEDPSSDSSEPEKSAAGS